MGKSKQQPMAMLEAGYRDLRHGYGVIKPESKRIEGEVVRKKLVGNKVVDLRRHNVERQGGMCIGNL